MASFAVTKFTSEVKTIADRAQREGRDFTPAEQTRVTELLAKAKAVKDRQDEFDELTEFGRSFLVGTGHPCTKSVGAWGNRMQHYLSQVGAKTLTPNGAIDAPELSAGIVEHDEPNRSLLEQLTFEPLGTGSFDYVRETVRTHAATTVPAGTPKPESDYALEKVSDRARTVAHLSPPIDNATLADVPDVLDYLDGALRAGVETALETAIVNGDSSTPGLDDFDGILNTSGTQAQAFDTDLLRTCRLALRTLQAGGLRGRLTFVMNAGTWAGFELLTTTTPFALGDPGTAGRNVPVDGARQSLWGQRVVLSEAIDDDLTILGDFGPDAIRVREREGVLIEWSDANQHPIVSDPGGATASGFQTNRKVFRAEGRYGLELRRPWAFVITDLA